MNVFEVTLEAFSVIGREGSTADDPGIVLKLWKEFNERYAEIEDLVPAPPEGENGHVWGIMSDLGRKLMPWEDGFTIGLYLAGTEVPAGTAAPEGWTVWDIPARTYMVMEIEEGRYGECFRDGLENRLPERGYVLAGAVCDRQELDTWKDYLYFPVAKKQV